MPRHLHSRAATGWLQSLAGRLPSQCAVCHAWPSQRVCTACLKRFGSPRERCPGCALAWSATGSGLVRCPDCRREPLPLDSCHAALDYGYPWSQLLTQMKFQARSGWADFFAERLLAQDGVRTLLAALAPNDWLLPLPLSPERLAERGFNQAWELGKALKARSGCAARMDGELLLRVRHAPPQSALDRRQRLVNVQGAYAVDPLRRAELAGRQVLLVDDVMTSGASLSAAAEALRRCGAHGVLAVVAARTPP